MDDDVECVLVGGQQDGLSITVPYFRPTIVVPIMTDELMNGQQIADWLRPAEAPSENDHLFYDYQYKATDLETKKVVCYYKLRQHE